MRFDDCLKIILKFEGGYSDRKEDRGGATNFGVTQTTYDTFRLNTNKPLQPVKFITEQEAHIIYHMYYWTPSKAPQLPEPLDLVMFDSWIQHRPKVAMQFLQQALGIPDDGKYGQQTATAVADEVKADRLHALCENIIHLRLAFYNRLALEGDQVKNLNGWRNRMRHLQGAVDKHFST